MNGFIHQDGIQLAREATLLAAQSLMQAPVDRVITIEDGLGDEDEQWEALWSRMQTHEQATQPSGHPFAIRTCISPGTVRRAFAGGARSWRGELDGLSGASWQWVRE